MGLELQGLFLHSQLQDMGVIHSLSSTDALQKEFSDIDRYEKSDSKHIEVDFEMEWGNGKLARVWVSEFKLELGLNSNWVSVGNFFFAFHMNHKLQFA